VKVLYGEGVAPNTGPESCVAPCEGRGEALTGEHVSQPVSGESHLRGADTFPPAESNTFGAATARHRTTPRRRRVRSPWHVSMPSARFPRFRHDP
jgi:hypothetical protein